MTISVGRSYVGDIVGGAPLTYWQGIGYVGMEYGERGKAPPGEGNLSLRVDSTYSATIEQHVLYSVGCRWDQQIGADMSLDVGANLDVAVGRNHIDSAAEKRIIQSGQKLELICGHSRIALHSDGRVQISGRSLNVSVQNSIRIFAENLRTVAKAAYKVVANCIDLN